MGGCSITLTLFADQVPVGTPNALRPNIDLILLVCKLGHTIYLEVDF
jgi:hypothetical protein